MDLDDADIRLLDLVRKRHRHARWAKFLYGGQAVFFAALALISVWMAPDIPVTYGPEIDVYFEVLRWQARAAWIPMAVLFGVSSGFWIFLWIRQSERARCDALVLKLMGKRSGYPEDTR